MKVHLTAKKNTTGQACDFAIQERRRRDYFFYNGREWQKNRKSQA